MTEFILMDENGPLVRYVAEGGDRVPTEITKAEGAVSHDADELVAYSKELAEGGRALLGITSRMGHDTWLTRADGSEEELQPLPTPWEGSGTKVAKTFMERLEESRARNRDRLGEAEDLEDEKEVEYEGTILKTDPAKRLVFGWAYITHDREGNLNIDKSGDFLEDPEELETSAYNYVIKSRHGDADHTNVKASDLVESIVFTPEKIAKMGLTPGSVPTGWWVGFKVHDDKTWDRVEKGELKSFSIHGKGIRSKVEE